MIFEVTFSRQKSVQAAGCFDIDKHTKRLVLSEPERFLKIANLEIDDRILTPCWQVLTIDGFPMFLSEHVKEFTRYHR